MLSVTDKPSMQNIIMPNVVMLSIDMLSVVVQGEGMGLSRRVEG
jgi:hypothetical protein